MKQINWKIRGNEYLLKTPYGVAIINEIREDIEDKNAIGARFGYLAKFINQDGIEQTSNHSFDSFDSAEGWLLWGIVMEIDQPKGNKSGMKKLFASLNLSEKLLPGENIEPHLARINMIKQTLQGKTADLEQEKRAWRQQQAQFQKYLREFPPINWQQQGNEFFAQVDHERVVIKETRNQNKWLFGRSHTYYPWIEQSLSQVFKGSEEISFEDAEEWLKNKLFEINHPLGGEIDLEYLVATLDLCIEALPEKTNPIHYLRLEWIKSEITDILA